MNGDEAVQKTNDDAQQSKAACVNLGYFKDDFVKYFVRKQGARYTLCSGRAVPTERSQRHGEFMCSCKVPSDEPGILHQA